MNKIKGKFIIGIILAIVLITWFYKVNAKPTLTSDEKSKIFSLVNSYYNNMMNKDYKSAMKLVDITKTDYDKAILTLNEGNYHIKKRLLLFDENTWIIPCNGTDNVYYDEKNKSFYVQTGVLTIYKNIRYEATENVYVRKVGASFKITKIMTDDRFGYIRGSYVKDIKSGF